MNMSNNFSDLLTNNVFHESLVLRIVEVSIIVILIVLCVIGNCLLFYIIVTTSPRWWTTPANFFNVNLAFTDLMVGIVVLPFMAMSISWQSWLLSDFLCQSTAFAMILLMASSTLTLSVISLDRYFCICLPLHYQSVVTTERVASVVTVLWLTSFLLASIPLFGWGRYTFRPQSIPICSVLLEGQQRHVILLWSFMILLPITVMIYSYVQILKVARKQANQIGCVENHFNSSMMTGTNETIGTSQNGTISFGNNDSKHFVSRSLKSLKIVSIIIGTFFLCWGPYIGFNFWCLDNDKPIPYLADLLTTFLAFTNSSVNPYLIIMFNRDFKIAFRNIFNRVSCFKNRQQE